MGTCTEEKARLVIQDCYTDSLTNALKKHGVAAQNFFPTLHRVPLLDEAYAHAQQSRSELFMDEIIHIADTEIDAQRARNRIEVRRLYASKMKPNKFGDRIDVNLTANVDIRGALDAARNRIRDIIEMPKTQLLETTTTIQSTPPGIKPGEEIDATIDELDKLLL